MPILPQPQRVDAERLVENVFPLQGHPDYPDNPSHQIAEQYLIDRYAGPPPEGQDPSVILVPTEVPQIRIGTHLVWPSKEKGNQFSRWVRANLLGLTVLNATINLDQLPNIARDAIEEIQGAKDGIEDKIGIGKTKKTTERTVLVEERRVEPGAADKQELFFQSQVGEVETMADSADRFFAELSELTKSGATINRITEIGVSSDDYRAKTGIDMGRKSDDNARLSADRVSYFDKLVTEQAASRGITLPRVEKSNTERVIEDPGVRESFTRASQQFGYKDFDAALDVYNDTPEKLPPVLRDLFNTQLGKNRGVSVVIDFTHQDHEYTAFVPKTERIKKGTPDAKPENASHEYDLDLLPFFIPPIPGLHKRPGMKTVMEPVFIPGVEGEDEWVRIYEEGANEDNTLKKEAWAYTRKYQEMFRDGRIKNIYKMGYVDAGGIQQTMRVLFADHTPELETVMAFGEALQSYVQMRGGDIGHNLDAIVVYPEENAGLIGNSPKQIGIGIDHQQEVGVLGTAYYSLGLVEMHMPTRPTDEDLSKYMGALWTYAHELGHFVDHNQEPARLDPIDSRLDRHFVVSNQRADLAETDYNRLQAQTLGQHTRRRTFMEFILRQHPPTDRRWWLKRGLENLHGHVSSLTHDMVADSDSRLKESLLIRIQNRFPTIYGGKSKAEHWAESMANAVTGIGIPFREQARMDRRNIPTDPNFARTYAIGTATLRLIQDKVGSDPDADYVSWPGQTEVAKHWVHEMTTVEDDDHLEPLARQARLWDFRREDDRRVLSILARARRNQRS